MEPNVGTRKTATHRRLAEAAGVLLHRDNSAPEVVLVGAVSVAVAALMNGAAAPMAQDAALASLPSAYHGSQRFAGILAEVVDAVSDGAEAPAIAGLDCGAMVLAAREMVRGPWTH